MFLTRQPGTLLQKNGQAVVLDGAVSSAPAAMSARSRLVARERLADCQSGLAIMPCGMERSGRNGGARR
jgi:hypothetical protein